jgi:hypothetical protein
MGMEGRKRRRASYAGSSDMQGREEETSAVSERQKTESWEKISRGGIGYEWPLSQKAFCPVEPVPRVVFLDKTGRGSENEDPLSKFELSCRVRRPRIWDAPPVQGSPVIERDAIQAKREQRMR